MITLHRKSKRNIYICSPSRLFLIHLINKYRLSICLSSPPQLDIFPAFRNPLEFFHRHTPLFFFFSPGCWDDSCALSMRCGGEFSWLATYMRIYICEREGGRKKGSVRVYACVRAISFFDLFIFFQYIYIYIKERKKGFCSEDVLVSLTWINWGWDKMR